MDTDDSYHPQIELSVETDEELALQQGRAMTEQFDGEDAPEAERQHWQRVLWVAVLRSFRRSRSL